MNKSNNDLIKINLNNNSKYIEFNSKSYEYLEDLKRFVLDTMNTTIHPNKIFLKTQDGKLITHYNYKKLDIREIDIIYKINGGVVDGIYNMLKGIIKMFEALFKILTEFGRMVELLFEILYLVFDPPTLIDDILFAVTFGINEVMNKMSSAISNGMSEPEDDTSEKGIFATRQEEGNTTCMSPTYSTLFLLIICPPLAIMYKLGFWKGFVSSIICGVLCVKLFYFPGLLFAILHVLC
jgi:hypothetical protein